MCQRDKFIKLIGQEVKLEHIEIAHWAGLGGVSYLPPEFRPKLEEVEVPVESAEAYLSESHERAPSVSVIVLRLRHITLGIRIPIQERGAQNHFKRNDFFRLRLHQPLLRTTGANALTMMTENMKLPVAVIQNQTLIVHLLRRRLNRKLERGNSTKTKLQLLIKEILN